MEYLSKINAQKHPIIPNQYQVESQNGKTINIRINPKITEIWYVKKTHASNSLNGLETASIYQGKHISEQQVIDMVMPHIT